MSKSKNSKKELKDRGNILIAEYMDLEDWERNKDRAGTVESLGYHEYWEWIMPVCEKIEKKALIRLSGRNEDYCCEIFPAERESVSYLSKVKITALWWAIVLYLRAEEKAKRLELKKHKL